MYVCLCTSSSLLNRYQYIIYMNATSNDSLSESTSELDDYVQVGVSYRVHMTTY